MSKIKWVPFILLMVVLCLWSVTNKPKLYGDGSEYQMMSISIANHLTPNQVEADIKDWEEVLNNNQIKGINNYAGYFEDLSGDQYSYHFWFYSLICSPIYLVLKVLDINELKMFQVANVLLMGIALYSVIASKMERRFKIWMLVGLINPIWLYVPWSHPEVFTFSLLFISLVKWVEKKPVWAALFSAIASWQNPGAAIFTAFISVKAIIEVCKQRKITRSFILTGISSSLVLFPFIWYWIHYHAFSLISKTHTGNVSLEKVGSLFLDPNFGMVWYIPIALIYLVYRVFTKDTKSIIAIVMLLIIALICSVQMNWNSGSTWINRYAVWMIPIVIFGTLHASRKWMWIAGIVHACVLILCFSNYNFSYTKFTPLAKTVMSVAPGIYNPPYEVFIERSIGKEIIDDSESYLPITVVADGNVRKTLTEEMKYINYRPKLDLKGSSILFSVNKDKDINQQDMVISFDGFHNVEVWNGKNARWLTNDARVSFVGQQGKNAKISFLIGSFHETRKAQISFNDEVIFDGEITTTQQEIRFNRTLSELNKIEIKTYGKIPRVSEIPEYKSNDPRRIAFSMMDLSVNQ